MGFTFDGDLDDVPTDAAAALARVARVLLAHGDRHSGRPATVRVARLGALLNLWLTDPECSADCLRTAGHLEEITGPEAAPPGDVRVVLNDAPDGGLRLHWVLLPAAETLASRPRIVLRRWTRGARHGRPPLPRG